MMGLNFFGKKISHFSIKCGNFLRKIFSCFYEYIKYSKKYIKDNLNKNKITRKNL